MTAPRPALRRWRRPDLQQVAGEYSPRLARFDAAVRDLSLGEGAPPGFDPARYLGEGTPRVRPLLVLLSAQAAASGGEPAGEAATEHVAVAAELLHLAVGVHDTAFGRADGRRARAARRLLGGAIGLLGANHLTLRALELARLTPAPEIVGDLLEALREAATGHALAHGLGGRLATEQECLDLIDRHAGAIFSFACRSGARLGGADRPAITRLGRYGRHTGIAWAIAEDLAVLDLEGDELARELGLRAITSRPPLPVALASAADPDLVAGWRALARRPAASRALGIAERVHRVGAPSEGRRRLALESWSARRALSSLPASPAREALDRLASALVE